MMDYPDKINAYDGVTLVLAICLLAAPWAAGFSGDRPAVGASLVAGFAIGACAIIALTEFTRLFEEIDVALGAAIAAAPWIVGYSHDRAAATTHVALGGLVVLVSLGELLMLRSRPPQSNM